MRYLCKPDQQRGAVCIDWREICLHAHHPEIGGNRFPCGVCGCPGYNYKYVPILVCSPENIRGLSNTDYFLPLHVDPPKVIYNLDTGVDYYVRVSARNSLGYGGTQSSSPTYQHPYEEPTAPTDVALGVTSDTMLTVSIA